jgi:Protein of unknown function (DUF3309)
LPAYHNGPAHRIGEAGRLDPRNRHHRLVPGIRLVLRCNRTAASLVESGADLAPARKSLRRELQENKTMRLILLILVIILLVGALPAWPYSGGWGYYPSGGLGLVLVILLIMALLGVV